QVNRLGVPPPPSAPGGLIAEGAVWKFPPPAQAAPVPCVWARGTRTFSPPGALRCWSSSAPLTGAPQVVGGWGGGWGGARGPGAGRVEGAGGVESFLRGAGGEPCAQDGVLVAVVGGGVDGEAEGMRRAAVA